MPDFQIVVTLVDKIGAAIERSRKGTTVCTRNQLDTILDRMGAIVAEHVTEEVSEKIREGWMNIALEGRA